MSTYHVIACEKCREQQPFLSQGMGGFGWMGRADAEVPAFVEKHCLKGHSEHLRVFDEHDPRYDDYSHFDPNASWDVEP